MNNETKGSGHKVPSCAQSDAHFIWPLGKDTTPDEMNTSSCHVRQDSLTPFGFVPDPLEREANPGSIDGFELTIPYGYDQGKPWQRILVSN